MNCPLPLEIIHEIFSYLSFTDLARVERTSRLYQSIALDEIERRIIKSRKAEEEWGILIQIGKGKAKPIRFDATEKKAYYNISMDPVTIRTMFDHRRPIHCMLLRKRASTATQLMPPTTTTPALNDTALPIAADYASYNENGFTITVEKGIEEGKRLEVDVRNDTCHVRGIVTKQPNLTNCHSAPSILNAKQLLKKEETPLLERPQHQILAPTPFIYTLQITELALPLCTIAL